jgi:hypothetical protein
MGVRLLFAERRENPRFQVENMAYVITGGNSGLISDISREGLSWRYVERKNGSQDTSTTLDIVSDDLELSLQDIPYTFISDCEAEHDCPDSSLVIRRRSVLFGDLTARQRAGLEEIIGVDLPRSLRAGQLGR